jgi:hypothetical protein
MSFPILGGDSLYEIENKEVSINERALAKNLY